MLHLLVGLVVVVWVLRGLHAVADELFKRGLLADEFDQFGDAASAAQYDQFFFLEQEFLDRAALLLT